MRHLLSVSALVSVAVALSGAESEPSPLRAPPAPRKAGSEVSDTLSILAQHRPTSGDGQPGIFRMQAAGEVDLIAIPHTDDVFTGRADFWLPVVGGDMAIRIGAPLLRYQVSEHTDVGLGDLNLHWDWAPTIAGPNGLLVSVDTTWDTASRDRLGVERHTIAPAVAYAVPIGHDLTIAPGISHRLSWGPGDGQRISFTEIHGSVTWLGSPTFWVMADPVLNVNHESDHSWFSVDVEAGMQVTRVLAVYVRPGLAFGDERAYDAHAAAGVSANF